MNNIKFLLTLALCFCCSLSYAQKRISGRVWSKQDGPIVMAYVVEQDKNNRNVTAAQTDANGNFSMVVKNPENKLRVSYIGYQTKVMAIGANTKFNIELIDKNTFKEASVTVTRKTRSNGLVIPEREISTAQQTLDMDQMAGLSFETAADALQGEIAGLDIVSNSGNLGSGSSMRLRGVSSINGSQEPLIVVDGNILEDYNNDDLDLDNMENEEQFATLLQVAPEDIASIKVLKDAAATAIWGSRGANGVIEITTRRGARGKTRVNFSYRFSGAWQPEGMNMLNGDGYTMMLKEAYHNPRILSEEQSNIAEIMYLQNYSSYYGNYNKNTDWVKEVTQFGQTHNYSVSVSGGGEKANFRVSGTYDHETGTIIKQALDRLTTRLALDYWVSDRIKFSSTFALTYTKNKKNYTSDLLGRAYNAMPNMSVYRNEYRETADGVGEYFNTGEYFIMPPAAGERGLISPTSGKSSYFLSDMVNNGNPVAIANLAWANTSSYTIQPQFQLEYKLLGKSDDETQLDYRGEVYLNAFTQTDDSYYPGSLTSKSWYDSGGTNLTSDYEQKHLKFTTRHQLTFHPHFANDQHQLQVMGRFEVSTQNSTTQYLSSNGIVGGISDPTVPGYLTDSWTGTGKGHEASGLGSLHYAYGSKYVFDVTVRADGSTRFGSGNKWGVFPGISGRWNISDEAFFEPLKKVVSMFALAPGWGINGNTPGSEGLMYNKYATNNTAYNGTQVMYPSNLKLTEIRWEKTKSWNVGVYLNLFEDLIQLNLNVYNKKTTDLLNSNVRVPSTSGFSYLSYANVGDMENEGWELYASTREIFKVGKFSMKLRGNIAQNLNTITKMDASVLASNNVDYGYANGEYMKRVQIGNALGGIYGFRFKGVYAYDYDHNGYFTNDEKNQWYDAQGNQNTAAAQTDPELRKSTPIVFDAAGNVVYDKNGNPLPMYFNYGGKNYQFQGGDAIYEDINHDGNIDELDIVYLGTSNPKLNGGFGLEFKYDRWTLKTNFNFRVGNKIINLARLNAESMLSNKNQSQAVSHRWRKNGQVTTMPRAINQAVTASFNSLVSDRYVEPGDFLRFQYFQLSYSVKPDKLKKLGLSSLNIAASGNNLIFWSRYSGVDPEHSCGGMNPCIDNSQTPRSRSFTFSLNFGF
ncbi:MAG: SusC/RagA family TonB-linked outer membrane protein [Bacteroidales bacterium]|nr:SusC/RagA family TonB-linked outer membrane protein [Bacteroidales bacterium]